MYRLNRLFHPRSGRALDVAIDHGLFGETKLLAGIEDMPTAVSRLIEAGPDALQLTVGQAALLQSSTTRPKPSLVLRGDVANVYGNPLDSYLFSMYLPNAIDAAVKLDAVAVCVNLIDLPDHPEIREANIAAILELRPHADRLGMPLMIEPLAMITDAKGQAYITNGAVDSIVTLVRQAKELGADLIKADATEDLAAYDQVVRAAGGTPLLVRGGGAVGDAELFRRTISILKNGARGIVYGRNIIQHRDPKRMTMALLAILHDGASAEDAERLLTGETE